MASKNSIQTAQEPDEACHSPERLAKDSGISSAILCGVCAQEGWQPGKTVSQGTFTTALKRFMKGGGNDAARR